MWNAPKKVVKRNFIITMQLGSKLLYDIPTFYSAAFIAVVDNFCPLRPRMASKPQLVQELEFNREIDKILILRIPGGTNKKNEANPFTARKRRQSFKFMNKKGAILFSVGAQ